MEFVWFVFEFIAKKRPITMLRVFEEGPLL